MPQSAESFHPSPIGKPALTIYVWGMISIHHTSDHSTDWIIQTKLYTPGVRFPCLVRQPSMLKLLSHQHHIDDRARRSRHIETGRLTTDETLGYPACVWLQHQQQHNYSTAFHSLLYWPIFTVQCTLAQSVVLRSHVVHPSVRPSVTLVDCDHTDWKSWKLTVQTISPTRSLFVAKRQPPTPRGTWGNLGKLEVG